MSEEKITVDGHLTMVQTTINTAFANKDIQACLVEYGYDQERLNEGKSLYETAAEVHQEYQTEYKEHFQATNAYEAVRKEADKIYMRHVRVARVAFKNNRQALKMLDLGSRRERGFSEWLTQARHFYSNILGNQKFLSQLNSFGITSQKLEAGNAILDRVENAYAEQEKEKTDAQRAANKRDQALSELNDWVEDFTEIARVALEDNPRLLEKMGIDLLKESEKITITVLIEIPKGSRNKYEFDKEHKMVKFDRMLFSAVHYPSDYGFIPNTLAQDGDPLDALVLVWEPTFPGCLVEAKPVGLFRMWDENGPDAKILCVPTLDPLWNHLETLSDVPPHLLKEIEHFFTIYKELEEKKVGVEGWEDREAAIRVIHDCERRYQEQR